MTETALSLSAASLTPYSGRGIQEQLRPIGAAAALRRTVNGALVDLSAAEFRKYAVTLTCNDMNAPALDGIWPGRAVTVDCLTELAYVTSGGSPSRSVVTGSSRVVGTFTFYRPSLSMRVIAFNVTRDEWGATVGWSIELEEV